MTFRRRLKPKADIVSKYANRITDERIAAAKLLYPSLSREWTVAMVDECADRLMPLLTRRIERLASKESL